MTRQRSPLNGDRVTANCRQDGGIENSICFEKKLPLANVTIRVAQSDDAELLADLGRETFSDAFGNHPLMPAKDLSRYLDQTFTLERIAAELADPNAIFLVAEIDSRPAGYAKVEINRRSLDINASKPMKLKRLYSRQAFLGAGVGASLMKRCLESAVEHAQDAVWLSVWENNLRAQKFYRKWNFEPCGVIDFPLGNAMMKDVVMVRHLPFKSVR